MEYMTEFINSIKNPMTMYKIRIVYYMCVSAIQLAFYIDIIKCKCRLLAQRKNRKTRWKQNDSPRYKREAIAD